MPQNSLSNSEGPMLLIVISAICGFFSATFSALCKWLFVSKRECECLRAAAMHQLEREKERTDALVEDKLDDICAEIHEIKEHYTNLQVFVGGVLQYMKQNPKG